MSLYPCYDSVSVTEWEKVTFTSLKKPESRNLAEYFKFFVG